MRGKYMGITLPIQETRDSALLKKFIQVADSSLKNVGPLKGSQNRSSKSFWPSTRGRSTKQSRSSQARSSGTSAGPRTSSPHPRRPPSSPFVSVSSSAKPTNCKDSDAIGPLEINTGTFLEGCYYGGFGKSGPQDFGELVASL